MKQGPSFALTIPEFTNYSSFFLEESLSRGVGQKIAAYYEDEFYTYGQLCALTNKVGNILKQLGVDRQDRVLLILQDSPDWLAGWFGTMKIGGVATHAYTYLLASDYEYFVGYVQPKVVIVDDTTLDNVREGIRKAGWPAVLLVAGQGVRGLGKDEYSLVELQAEASPVLDTAPTRKSEPALWNFSGGTTGKPKGVPHNHEHGIVSFESANSVLNYRPDDVVLRVPKLFFHYARDLGMQFPLRMGGTVCLSRERSTPENIFKLIEKHRPTILLNVPTMMRAMLQSPKAKSADLSSLRLCMSSGELLSEQLYKEFTDTFGVEVSNVHGSAEAYLGYFLSEPGKARPGSSGKIAPLVAVKVVDPEGNKVSQGEPGVVWVHSAASGSHYHGEPEKSKTTFLGDGWVNTNDLFREDEDGYFWYMGRSDDLIKVSGVYVTPLEIEICLAEHPAVQECAVLGIHDSDGLLKSKAFVALMDGVQPSADLAGELVAFCRQKMAAYKAPKLIEFLPELPKTGQGKIDRRKLRMLGADTGEGDRYASAEV